MKANLTDMLKSFVSTAVKLGLSAGLIWYATRNLDIETAADRVSQMPVGSIVLAALLFCALLLNNTARWQLVMRAVNTHLPFGRVFYFLYIGMFFNQVLPSSVGGDAVRIFLVRKDGAGWRGAINGILLERVATLFGLVILVVATQPLLLARIGDNPAKFAFPALAVMAVVGIGLVMLLDKFPERFQRWRIVRAISSLAEDTRHLFLAARYGLPAIAMGVTGFALLSGITFVLAGALGIEISLLDCLVLIPPVMLITTIPISVAGWGVREAAMQFALGFVGVDEQSAVILSLVLGVAILVASIPAAILWLKSGYRRKDVTAEVPEGESAAR